jgi:hypothetical protein
MVYSDGTPATNTATVSSSWGGTKAFPKNGFYRITLDPSACGEQADLYVNGYLVQRVRLPSSGHARRDVVLDGRVPRR